MRALYELHKTSLTICDWGKKIPERLIQTRSQVPEVWPNSKLNHDILLYLPTFPSQREKQRLQSILKWDLESNYTSKDKAEIETRFTTQKAFHKMRNKHVRQRIEKNITFRTLIKRRA